MLRSPRTLPQFPSGASLPGSQGVCVSRSPRALWGLGRWGFPPSRHQSLRPCPCSVSASRSLSGPCLARPSRGASDWLPPSAPVCVSLCPSPLGLLLSPKLLSSSSLTPRLPLSGSLSVRLSGVCSHPRRGSLSSLSPPPTPRTNLQFMSPQGQGFPRAGGREPGAFNPSLSAAGGAPGVSWAAAWGGEACARQQQGRGSEGVWTPGGLYRGLGRAGGGQAAGEGGLTHPDSPSLPAFSIQTERLPCRAHAAALGGGHGRKSWKS